MEKHTVKFMKTFLIYTIILFIVNSYCFSEAQVREVSRIKGVRAKITDVVSEKKDYKLVELTIEEGDYINKKFNAEFYSTYNFYGITLKKNDEVFVSLNLDLNKNVTGVTITNVARDKYMIYLFLGYMFLLFIIGGFKGLRAVISMIISYLVIIKVLIPLIINGYNPVYITLVISSVITVFTLILIGGFNMKTASAILGTLCGLTVAAIIAVKIGSFSHITGVVDDEFYLLNFLPLNSSFSYKGLLFSGIIIGSLGAVMDVSMSIASTINELRLNSYNMNTFKLIAAGMNVGRDAIGTMTNTLILAYVGGSIYMMMVLVAQNTSLIQLINQEAIASEILRSMAGSIGLIITVPVTALMAGLMMCRKN